MPVKEHFISVSLSFTPTLSGTRKNTIYKGLFKFQSETPPREESLLHKIYVQVEVIDGKYKRQSPPWRHVTNHLLDPDVLARCSLGSFKTTMCPVCGEELKKSQYNV